MAEVVCQLCHIRVEKSALEGHISTEHLKIKVEKFPYGCPSCDFRGPTRDYVERHQKERGHKGEVKDESWSISYLASLTKLISTSCEAAQNVGMSAVLEIFDNNLASGESFPTQAQQSNAEKFAVPTRIKAEPNPKGIQIHKGTVDDPVVIDSDSDVTDVHPVMLMGKNVVLKNPMKNHMAEPTAGKSQKRLASKNNSTGTADLSTEPIKAKWRRVDSTPTQTEVVQVDQHSTATEKNANRVVKRLNSGRFKCHRCGKSFGQQQHLRRHSYTHQPANLPCVKCGEKFSSPATLYQHLKRKHVAKADLKWKCPDPKCDRRFSCRWLLIKHSEVHSKPLCSCDKCDAKFKRPAHLKRHKMQKHPVHN